MKYVILFLMITTQVFAQSNRLSRQRDDLKKIRSEIVEIKKRLENEKAKEKSILDMLSALDREIDLTNGLIEQLKREEKRFAQAMIQVAYELKDKREELDRLQKIYEKRLVYLYKHGKLRDIDLLLSTDSFNQILIWVKFQRLLAENDRRNYNNMMNKKLVIEDKKNKFKEELLTRRQIIDEKTKEQINLSSTKKQREVVLSQVQANEQLYVKKLEEYQVSAKEIERIINVQETKRISMGTETVSSFPALKGRMIWPAQGEVITHFGKNKHPVLKTVTTSLGIDIRSKAGEDVRVVAEGVVTAITWQRGRGNIIIVDHLGGYYTVYTHLQNIFVQVNNKVSLGDVIGTVGESGSLKGPMLHFEVWQKNQVQNPLEWLG
ncbi:peptidoglycan DD-metalloendopeptidase family protein [candidate division KSB1 bacterium]|nr:peptidoglycan DD-metalloendopeptidase family protein [candidate division KSB1 bacterium]